MSLHRADWPNADDAIFCSRPIRVSARTIKVTIQRPGLMSRPSSAEKRSPGKHDVSTTQNVETRIPTCCDRE